MAPHQKNKVNPIASDELVQAVAEDSATAELEKLQRKIAREERKQRRVIEEHKKQKAVWLLPSLLFATTFLAWLFSKLTW